MRRESRKLPYLRAPICRRLGQPCQAQVTGKKLADRVATLVADGKMSIVSRPAYQELERQRSRLTKDSIYKIFLADQTINRHGC